MRFCRTKQAEGGKNAIGEMGLLYGEQHHVGSGGGSHKGHNLALTLSSSHPGENFAFFIFTSCDCVADKQ
jgi:hypothetical protein